MIGTDPLASELEFHLQEVPSPFDGDFEKKARESLQRSILAEGGIPGPLNIVFCSDRYLLELHTQYLQKEDFTDIITFDYCEGEKVSGDLFISTERVEENAIEYGRPFLEELYRVMAHGVLHLLGYGDKSSSEAETMKEKEAEWLRTMGF